MRTEETAGDHSVRQLSVFGRSIAQFRDDLESALSGLSKRERRVIEADLKHPPWGAPTDSVALELNASEAAIRGIRSRARKKVREALANLGYEIESW
jgi:DNA-directed RNA polymerase specialized sigma24 family protein